MRHVVHAASTLLAAGVAAAQTGWSQQPAGPPARGACAMVYDVNDGHCVLFGGLTSLQILADTWERHGTQWTQRTPTTQPPARYAYAMSYDMHRDRVVLFGGNNSSSLFGDTWEYDGTTWRQINPASGPTARQWPAMAFDSVRGSTLLFGGSDVASFFAFDDTWEWNGSTWSRLWPPVSPSPRSGHGMASDLWRGQVVLHGGRSASAIVADTWIWNGFAWRPVATPTRPFPQSNVALAFDIVRGMVVFPAEGQFQPTWLFDGSQWYLDQRQTLAGRALPSLAFDWTLGRCVLYGGSVNFTWQSDTWQYDSAGKAEWVPGPPACTDARAPTFRALTRPILGHAFVMEATNLGAAAIAFFGFSDATWNSVSLPYSLANLGMPGCDLQVRPDFQYAMTPVNSASQVAVSIPTAPSLVGLRFFAQALTVAPGANPLGALLTNSARGVTGVY